MKRTIISFAIAALVGTSAHASCTIQYNCGTGATGTKPANQSITEATKVFTPSAPGTCAKSGQVFSHWQVSSTASYLNGGGSGTMYDAAWAGTEYTIPFTTASDTCSNRSATITLTGQWVDASYVGIPTSKSYTDAQLNAKQPKFENLGNSKLMLYSNATNGATLSRDIVTELGTSTSATSVPTRGAINTKLATKQNKVNGTAGWVMENTGTAGELKERPVYSTTDNYSYALVEAGDLNQIIINAVNSELTQVADGWQINTVDNLTLPTFKDVASVLATPFTLDASLWFGSDHICHREFNGDGDDADADCSNLVHNLLGDFDSRKGMWSSWFNYYDPEDDPEDPETKPYAWPELYGNAACSSVAASTTGTVATAAQNTTISGEYANQTGTGNVANNQTYCWCKLAGFAIDGQTQTRNSAWVYGGVLRWYANEYGCAEICSESCGYRIAQEESFRQVVFGTVQ